MQTTKLGVSAKVFAQLERIFNRVSTRSLPFDVAASSHALATPVVSETTVNLELATRSSADLILPLAPIPSHELGPSIDFSPASRQIPCWGHAVTVHSCPDLGFFLSGSRGIDFSVSTPPSLHALNCRLAPSSVKTSPLDISALSRSPLTHRYALTLHEQKSHHSSHLPGNIPVTRHPMVLEWVPKSEMRVCWRKAVLRTKRSPQELKMLGFFPGIPLSNVRQIEFSHSPVRVKYWLNTENRKKGPLASLSLFHSIPDKLFFLTSSQDE